MKMNKLILSIFFVIVFLFISGINASSQLVDKSVSDSLKLLPVKLTDVPIRSAETLMKTRRILDELISEEEIAELKQHNDSILNVVEVENEKFLGEIEYESVRFLENRMLQLQSQKDIVENEKSQLSSIIIDLDKSLKFLADEQKIWANTKEAIKETGLSKTVIKRIDLIQNELKSAINNVSEKTEDMLSTLDRSSEVSIEMDLQLEKLEESIRKFEERMLLTDHPNIFRLNYSEENTKFSDTFKEYVKNEWAEIKSYSTDKLNEYILTFIIFVLLVYLFFSQQNQIIKNQENTSNFYKKKLGQVLAKPISTSLLITLFTTVFIFPNRPPAFRDLVLYLALIPLLVIMWELLNKKLFYILLGFAISFVFNIVFLIVQPENVVFRFNLIFIGFLELYLSWYFLFRIIESRSERNNRKLWNKRLGYTVFILTIIGLSGAISGNVLVAQKLLTTISFGIIASAILFATAITINGLLITFADSKFASKINFINNNGEELKKRTVAVLNFATIYYAVFVILRRLNIWNIVKDSVLEFFTQDLKVGEFEFSLGTIVIFFLVIYLSILVGKIIQVILEGDILSKMSMAKGLPHTVAVMVRYSIVSIGLFIAISAAGMDLSSMTVIIGAFGVGIGFGLQNIFNNMVSGLILLFERPVQIGDTIEVGTLIGKVNSIGMRSSYIKTFDGAEVIVPNGQLISNEVINWTLSDQQRRIEVIVGVSYSSDPHKVHQLLKQLITDHNDIMSHPLPQVLFNELGDSSLNFRLLFWTESIGQWIQIKSDVIFKIFDLLKENGIEIPFPQSDIHVRSIVQDLKEGGLKNDTPE